MSENKETKTKTIRPFVVYIREAIRFHEIGAVVTTRILFIFMLALTFMMYLLLMPLFESLLVQAQELNDSLLQLTPSDQTTANLPNYDLMSRSLLIVIGILIGGKAIIYFVMAFYGFLYYRRLTKPDENTVRAVLVTYLKKLPTLITVNLIYYIILGILFFTISILVVLICFIIPLFIPFAKILLPLLFIVATAAFAFLNMSVLEENAGIVRAFSATLKMTKENMRMLIRNLLLLFGLGMMLTLFATGMSSGLVALFLSSLAEVIIGMMTMKMTILMYGDLRGTPLPMKIIQLPAPPGK